jgi:hypothetical protein
MFEFIILIYYLLFSCNKPFPGSQAKSIYKSY